MQLNIVVKPFINVFVCILKHIMLMIRYTLLYVHIVDIRELSSNQLVQGMTISGVSDSDDLRMMELLILVITVKSKVEYEMRIKTAKTAYIHSKTA